MRFRFPWTTLSVASVMLSASFVQAQVQPQPVYPPPPAAYQPVATQPAPYQPGPAPAPAPQPYVAPAPAPEPTPVAEPVATETSASDTGNAAAEGGMNPNFGMPSDHDQVNGHLGFAYFGITGVPIGAATSTTAEVSAPVVGIRYWLNDGMGVDVGLGFGFASTGGTTYAPAAADTDVSGGGRFAFLLHGGLPISIYDAGHFNGLIIPELNIGYATGLDDNAPNTTADDTTYKGFILSMGARAGAEWHLEFLDIPQATIQVTIGLGLAYQSRNAETANAGTTVGTFGISTDALDLSKLLTSGVQFVLYI